MNLITSTLFASTLFASTENSVIVRVFIVVFLYQVLIATQKQLKLEDGKIEEAHAYQRCSLR